MKHLEFANGIEGDCRPDGEWCVQLADASFLMQHPPVGAPPVDSVGNRDLVRFPRLIASGDVRIAGQSQLGLGTWAWDETRGWKIVSQFSYGSAGPCIWTVDGTLHFAQQSNGSQGFRYVDEYGVIQTGDNTYNDATQLAHQLGVRALYEWTQLRGLTFGQGPNGHVILDGRLSRRVLHRGPCKWIRFTHDGTTLAVCFTQMDTRTVHMYWLTEAEAGQLPLDQASPVPPPVQQMQKPEVTVDVFNFGRGNNLHDGTWLEFYDRMNAQGAKVRVWVELGSMYMSIEYPGIGIGQTGARRPVR